MADKSQAERRKRFETSSGIDLPADFNPSNTEPPEYDQDLNSPGDFPFTRGIYSNMYRGRLWTMRQYAGYATAEESNARYKYLLAQGTTGLSVAFDLPTQIGLDSDDNPASGEVGKVGVAIDSLEDMLRLFNGIPLDWMGAAWCVVRAINTGKGTYWLWFGILIGLGLETKYTVVFFAFGIVVGLLLTPHRLFLKSKWIWLGALAALLIFLPNLLWLVRHDFPFLELMRNIRESGRDVARGPIAFIADQAVIMNPILFPLWMGGLVWLFVGKPERAEGGKGEGRKSNLPTPSASRSLYRIFGWAYVVMLVTFIVLKGKNYYLAPAYPILFAAGAIAFERLTKRGSSPTVRKGSVVADPTNLHSQLNTGTAGVSPADRGTPLPFSRSLFPLFPSFLRVIYVALIVIVGAAFAPLSAPILSPESYIRYQHALGIEPPKAENQPTGPLPQHFADEFGWEEMAREVAKVYNSLPSEERSQTAIFANSYGQAGAIDFFGAKFGLPKAISNHQNYWYWGPRDYTGTTVIVLGSDGEGDREHFKTVEVAGQTYHPYSRRDEHFPILLCRGLNQNLQTLWPSIKKWD